MTVELQVAHNDKAIQQQSDRERARMPCGIEYGHDIPWDRITTTSQ